MNEKLESRFGDIIQKAIEKAESVSCSSDDFVEGLKVMLGALTSRFESAKDEFGDGNE